MFVESWLVCRGLYLELYVWVGGSHRAIWKIALREACSAAAGVACDQEKNGSSDQCWQAPVTFRPQNLLSSMKLPWIRKMGWRIYGIEFAWFLEPVVFIHGGVLRRMLSQ